MPSIRRTIKKTSYALLFSLIIVLLLGWFIIPKLNFLRPAKTPDTIARESLVVEGVDIVHHESSVDVVARIRNPNPRDGVPDYDVSFIFLDAENKEIDEIHEKVNLLPGSLNYVSVLDIPIAETVSVRVDMPSRPVFITLPKTASLPEFNSFLRERSIRTIGNQEYEIQKALITNRGTLGYRLVNVTGIAFDGEGKVVGIGKTFLGEFMAGEQRSVTLQWPAPVSSSQRVILLPSTNIFFQDNIMSVTGDPSLLR